MHSAGAATPRDHAPQIWHSSCTSYIWVPFALESLMNADREITLSALALLVGLLLAAVSIYGG